MSHNQKHKKTRKAITLQTKLEIVQLHQCGTKVRDLGARFGLSHSSISTILRNGDVYMRELRNARPLQSTLIRTRQGLIPEMEKSLMAWIGSYREKEGNPPSRAAISERAKAIFERLKTIKGDSYRNDLFSASKGWYHRFKTRASWYSARDETDSFPKEETKKRKLEETLANRINQGESSNASKFSVIAIDNSETTIKDWIVKLNKMSYEQRMLASKFITNILLAGESGRLRDDCVQINVGRESQESPFTNSVQSISTSDPSCLVKQEMVDTDRLSPGLSESNGSHFDIDIEPMEYQNVKCELDDEENPTEKANSHPPNSSNISQRNKKPCQKNSFTDHQIGKDDEFYRVGLKIAAKLKKINEIDPRHRHFCEKMIHDTLFVGLMQQKINSQMQARNVS